MRLDRKTVGRILMIASGTGLLALAYRENPVLGFLSTLGLVSGLILAGEE